MQNCKLIEEEKNYFADLMDPIFVHLFAKTFRVGLKFVFFVGAVRLEANNFQIFPKARSSEKYLRQILKKKV